jgi:hypothetical protein
LATGAVSINTLAGNVDAGYAGNISGLGIATFAGVENFEITSGGFDDVITTGDGNDVVHAGGGSDIVNLAGGADEAIYTMAANDGASDVYKGGDGVDTLTLNLTQDQWDSDEVKADIAAYLAFQEAPTSPSGEAGSTVFKFTAFDLSVSEFENLRAFAGGDEVDPTSVQKTLIEFGSFAGGGSGQSVTAEGGADADDIRFGRGAGSQQGSATAEGGEGNDVISFGYVAGGYNGFASAGGGAGNDVISFMNGAGYSYGSVTAYGGSGNDEIRFGSAAINSGSASADGGDGNDEISFGYAAGYNRGTASADGGAGNDTISFDFRAGVYNGSASADGGAGDDDISFGDYSGYQSGSVSADGGAGNDTFTFGSNAGALMGSVSADGGAGADTFTFGTGAENLTVYLGEGDGDQDSVTFLGSVKNTTIDNWEYGVDANIDVADPTAWTAKVVNGNTVLTTDDEQSLTLIGITATDLIVTDFLI